MKKIAIIFALVAIVCLTGCRKEKVCRCSVLTAEGVEGNGGTIRLITITKGSCEDIRFVYYDLNGGTIPSRANLNDSVLCTDHHFDGDPDDIRTTY